MGNALGLRAGPAVVAALLALASRQYGLVTRRQWLGTGLSQRQLEHAMRSGGVRAVYPWVYALPGSRPCFERDVLAACLASGGIASHRCAAYLWKFRKFERPLVEVLVTAGRTPRLTGVRSRRTGRLDPSERTRLGALPVTSRARTLLDLVATSPHLVEGALDGVLHRRPRDLRSMQTLLERAGPRHPARHVLSPLVAARAAGRRPTESEFEDNLLAVIRRYGLPEPVPQYPHRGRRIDFAYPELLFGIEAQGMVAHSAKEDVQRNAEKANDLIEWWILYFTHADVHGAPADVAGRIGDTMARRRAMLGVRPAA